MKIKIALADHRPVVIAGLSHFLGDKETIDIVGVARDSAEVVDLLSRKNCDVLVTDFSLPGSKHSDGLMLIADLRQEFPALKIVVFTMIDNSAIINQLMRLGVRSVMSKSASLDHLIAAIYAVYAGATYFPTTDGTASKTMSDAFVASHGFQELSRREVEVIRLFVSGMSISEIAEYLDRAKQTVSTQKISAMRKLGVSRDADLYQYAFESGMFCHAI